MVVGLRGCFSRFRNNSLPVGVLSRIMPRLNEIEETQEVSAPNGESFKSNPLFLLALHLSCYRAGFFLHVNYFKNH